jgi:hypothetical protein
MKHFGWIFVAISLISLGCTRQELPEPEATANSPAWAAIPMTEDRILVLVDNGPVREAVVDVKWDDATRKQALADGFTRAMQAVSTRAIYRFNCKTLSIQTQSYSVLSERGETLTSQVHMAPKSSPVEPGKPSARYLAAACKDGLRPKQLQKLQLN